MPGTVLAPGIWWSKHSPDRRNVNRLTPQDETDMGASASFYDVRVRVEPLLPPAAVALCSPCRNCQLMPASRTLCRASPLAESTISLRARSRPYSTGTSRYCRIAE